MSACRTRVRIRGICLATVLSAGALPADAQPLNLAQSPLFLGTSVRPNVLVVLDNSQSMDGTMAGKLVAGDDDGTRGNIARAVLRSALTSYRSLFNWGLASFEMSGLGLYTTYGYYFGSDADVVYTNDCVGGLSASSGMRRCVANPQPANGFRFLTYAVSGDDPAINDVLYTSDYGAQLYGIGINNSTSYAVYGSRTGTAWDAGSFSGGKGTWSFTPTDAGFLPATPPNRRMFWLRRAWGYYGNVTGKGRINQPVAADSPTQYAALQTLLARETATPTTSELKNGAVFTPLAGTLDTVKSYFAGSLSGRTSPIEQTCQRNFVLLATDGNPTGRTDGSMYSLAELSNQYNAQTAGWSFGTAATDVFSRVSALRNLSFNGRTVDVQTYVIGLGDSVANASSVAALQRMASLGGTGKAFMASDPAALAEALRNVSIDIVSRTAAAAAVSLNSGTWRTGTVMYQGRFSSVDWSGQLLALPLSANGEPGTTPLWDAAQKLNAQAWNTGRQILTYRPSAPLGSRGVPLRWPGDATRPASGEIDSDLVAALNRNAAGVTDGFGAQRLEYLRGNTAREARNCGGCAAPVFRDRPITVLGDIVNSAPAYLGGPTGDYRDNLEAARYSSYAAARSRQAPVIFVGANDGLLHAFDATDGRELFAYLPFAVRHRLSELTAMPYSHVYSVDGSPSLGDVFIGGGWRTMLVSGMNAGAPGLFALDVTDAGSVRESGGARVVRWEVGDSDPDVGHIFGRPLLVKLRDGRWRAVTGNGYNSANGRAVLLLVDLETGEVDRVDTGSGSAAAPNGLSAVTAVSTGDNGVADVVYAGDLRGNLWKFDLSAGTKAAWRVAYTAAGSPTPLFAAGAGQPITARPDVSRLARGGYMVTVGTGRFVDIADTAPGATQTLYGIWDFGAPVAAADLQLQSFVANAAGGNGSTFRLSTHAVGPAFDAVVAGDNAISVDEYYRSRRGWKLVLPAAGERVVSDVAVRAGRTVASTLIPSGAACAAGADGWIVDVDLATGNRSPAFDTNGDNRVDAADRIGGVTASALRVGAMPSAPAFLRTSDKRHDDKLINTSAGTVVRAREAADGNVSRRMSWEQLR